MNTVYCGPFVKSEATIGQVLEHNLQCPSGCFSILTNKAHRYCSNCGTQLVYHPSEVTRPLVNYIDVQQDLPTNLRVLTVDLAEKEIVCWGATEPLNSNQNITPELVQQELAKFAEEHGGSITKIHEHYGHDNCAVCFGVLLSP